jgi:hypothetical protein
MISNQSKFSIAPEKVKCELGGKHHPRTIESIGDYGMHLKTNVCRKCDKIV